MLRQDPDADSAYSGESSNTDSGRGLSEEGEGLAGNHHHNNHQHHQHHHHTLPHHAGKFLMSHDCGISLQDTSNYNVKTNITVLCICKHLSQLK